MKKLSVFLFIMFYLAFLPIVRAADSNVEEELASMKAQFSQMQKTMAQYENRIHELENQVAAKNQPQGSVLAPISQPAVVARPAPSKWTPEIGAVADVLFTLDSPKTDTEGSDVLALREFELVLGSNVDPYSRLDATIAFSTSEDDPVDLEEVYLTRFGLPLGLTARVGKFKPKVGKTLGVHRDGLDTIDEPLVIQRYFGDEGFSKTGLDLTKNIDLPIPVSQQLALGVLEGGNSKDTGIFGGSKRRPTLYAHLKNYVDINDTTGFELGTSYMTGSRDADASMEVRAIAADATLTHNFNATQNMKIQAEAFNVDRKESFVEEDDGLGGVIRHDLDGNIWGAYGLLDFRVNPLWSVGGRYDFVEPIAVDIPAAGARREEVAYSGYLTFYQSEFARWRAQFTHRIPVTGKDDNAFYLQGTFAIGDHKHKLQ